MQCNAKTVKRICQICTRPIGKKSVIFEVKDGRVLWYEHAYCRWVKSWKSEPSGGLKLTALNTRKESEDETGSISRI